MNVSYLVTESQGFLAKVHGEANKPDLAILEVGINLILTYNKVLLTTGR